MPRNWYTKDGSIDTRFLPRVIYRPMGKEQAFGQSFHGGSAGDHEVIPTIEVDSRLTGLKRMEIEIHEALHLIFPALVEPVVKRAARWLARVLWSLGYRLPEEPEING